MNISPSLNKSCVPTFTHTTSSRNVELSTICSLNNNDSRGINNIRRISEEEETAALERVDQINSITQAHSVARLRPSARTARSLSAHRCSATTTSRIPMIAYGENPRSRNFSDPDVQQSILQAAYEVLDIFSSESKEIEEKK